MSGGDAASGRLHSQKPSQSEVRTKRFLQQTPKAIQLPGTAAIVNSGGEYLGQDGDAKIGGQLLHRHLKSDTSALPTVLSGKR